MSDYVMLTNTDYQSICDKLREKTGNVNLIKSGDIVGEIELISNFADTINVTNLANNIIDKSIVGIVDDKILTLRNYALCGCENLTHARFLSTTSIGRQALFGCTSLVVADFPKVETIGFGAFGGCTSLTSIFLPSLKELDEIMPFYGCTNLQKVDFPVLEQVGYQTLDNLDSLKTVNVPMVTFIDEDAFYNDSSLTNVNAPLVNTISSRAFYNCSNLKEANFPLLTSIDKQAFYGCESLTSIDFPNLEYLGKPAEAVGGVASGTEIFNYCRNLKTVNLPIVKEIYDSSFSHCSELTEVYMPLVETIGYEAFYYCEKLTSLDCPKLKSIGRSAFEFCPLSYINLPVLETIEGRFSAPGITELNLPMLKEGAFSQMTNLIKATLPNLTNIPYLGFMDCPSLKVIDFTNLTSIGSYYDDRAFSGCTSLDTLILRGNTVCEIGPTSFEGLHYDGSENTPFASGGTGGTVYVPETLIESYKIAENWSTLYNAGTCNFVAIEGSEYE